MAIAETVSNERVNKLREKCLGPRSVCLERGYWMTESYKETEGEPSVVRHAKALDKILSNMSLNIQEGELIVGMATSKPRASGLTPELRWQWFLEQMDGFPERHIDPYVALTEEEKAKVRDFLPYWKGKASWEKWDALNLEEALNLNYRTRTTAGGTGYPSHLCGNYEKVLVKGLTGVKKEVEEELKKLNLSDIKDLDKYQFLRASNIALDAAMKFAKRYADLARNMAEKETDSERKAELEKIAEICDHVPANPARSFHEALQSVWLTFLVTYTETKSGGSLGRVDQYLYPFYKKDIEEGKITREEARELIALFLIKNNGLMTVRPIQVAMMWAGGGAGGSITLGGVTPDGKDAVNELSYLILDAEMDVRLLEDFVIRIHKTNPDAFVMKACEVAKALNGKLKFVSDETNIQRLLKDGKPIEWARDYVIIGCFCLTVPYRSWDFQLIGIGKLPLMLELALNDGASRLSGEQSGPKTGDPRKFKSYDEVWEAYKKQLESNITSNFAMSSAAHQIISQYLQLPFLSTFFEGCIERGMDISQGGTAPYVTGSYGLRGATNVADSLAAIKKVVFEDKKITMEKLIDALDKDFEGEDEVLHLLQRAPKFGNDDDYVDSIMDEVIAHASNFAAKFKGLHGAITTTQVDAGPGAITDGYQIGALPDGRKAGEAICEGGLSPYGGRSVNGPTATMKSITKIDHLNFTNGDVVNMKFSPDALKDDQKMRKFVSLLRTYCETGGGLVQFNIIGADTLRDAQKHPERYRDLLVRVATYSAYFVELPKEAQDNIIARTEFEEV